MAAYTAEEWRSVSVAKTQEQDARRAPSESSTLTRAARAARPGEQPSVVERVQAAFEHAGADGKLPKLDAKLSEDVATLVERLRKLKARGGVFSQLAISPAVAALHVQARLGQG